MVMPVGLNERDLVRLWWMLSPGCQLICTSGEAYRLIFPGYPGGNAGPDVRDAVLIQSSYVDVIVDDKPVCLLSADQIGTQEKTEGKRRVGDIEFHLRTSDWIRHQHQDDARYNSVILHVAWMYDQQRLSQRQDGHLIPLCLLSEQSCLKPRLTLLEGGPGYAWPCHSTMRLLDTTRRARLLMHAGLLRFTQKAERFLEQLRTALPSERINLYDYCLIPELAEGLGYGRDRDFFRAVGRRFVGQHAVLPEPSGRMPYPAPLDSRRLRVLARCYQSWKNAGIWNVFSSLFDPLDPPDRTLERLRGALQDLGLSLARTDILVCNVVLPFAVAVAWFEGKHPLEQRAREVYQIHPGLPSNRITRAMCEQLQLAGEPEGACQQQGLHYIYQQTCREKQCAICLCGKSEL